MNKQQENASDPAWIPILAEVERAAQEGLEWDDDLRRWVEP